METVFYAYTILVMAFCIAAMASMLSLYIVTRNALCLSVAVSFFLYFLDLMLIFLDEYLGQGSSLNQQAFYAIRIPFVKAFLAMGILESIWIALCIYLDKRNLCLKIIPAFLFMATNIIIILLMPESQEKQWCFYSTREVFLGGMLLFLAIQYHQASRPYKASIKKLKIPVVVSGIICICIVFENTFLILIWEPSFEFMHSAAPLFISERNISENLLALALAVFALSQSTVALRLRYKEPPEPRSSVEKRYVDSYLDLYCEKHGLTRRERDILRLAIAGKNYQATASELYLAIGTVKSHMHNIFRKTGVKTRQDLLRDFWQN